MNWSDEKVFSLIELYKNCTALWDPKDGNYMKKNLKNDAWKDIAACLNEPEEACRSKIINLLSSYRREKAKEKKSTGTGKGTSQVYTSRWFAYEAFRFLQDRDKPRSNIDTDSTIELDEVAAGEEEVLQDEDTESSCAERQAKDRAFTRPKGKRRKQDETTKVMKDTLALLKSTAEKFDSSPTENEVKSFCNFVMAKMNNYSPNTRRGVQHAMFDVLMKADVGYFEQPSSSFVTPFPQFETQYGQQLPNRFSPINYTQSNPTTGSGTQHNRGTINTGNTNPLSPSTNTGSDFSDDFSDYI